VIVQPQSPARCFRMYVADVYCILDSITLALYNNFYSTRSCTQQRTVHTLTAVKEFVVGKDKIGVLAGNVA